MPDVIDRLIALKGAGTARTLEAVLGDNPVPSDGVLNAAANMLTLHIDRLAANPDDRDARFTVETVAALIRAHAHAIAVSPAAAHEAKCERAVILAAQRHREHDTLRTRDELHDALDALEAAQDAVARAAR